MKGKSITIRSGKAPQDSEKSGNNRDGKIKTDIARNMGRRILEEALKATGALRDYHETRGRILTVSLSGLLTSLDCLFSETACLLILTPHIFCFCS